MAKYDTIVVGGGAAGLIAAGFAAKQGQKTLIIEKNDRCARKVMITGKGRCNVTNEADLNRLIESVPVNGRFLYSAFTAFTPYDVMRLMEEQGVPLKTERGNRVFPVSDRASDVVDALVNFARSMGADRIRGRVLTLICQEDRVTGVTLQDGETYAADKVILATGGMSYPGTGSTGDGYRLAEQTGHAVTPLKPSLVPLVAHNGFCSRLQGLSLKNIAITVVDRIKKKTVYQDFGEMLFTHFGLSGPVILSASSHMREMEKKRYDVVIDLKPALTEEQLDVRLQRDFLKYANKDFINSLHDLLPNKLIPVFVSLSGIEPSTKVNQITKLQREALITLIKHFTVTIDGFRPIEEAIVTSGGVNVRQVNPKTMESKLIKGLYFAGEILDVDAYTGGFNLQIAFSTGYLAGMST